MPAPFVRPRTVPEILDVAFQILRQHYVPIVSATGLLLLPSIVLAVLLPPELAGLAAVAELLLSIFAGAATVVLVADLYAGREPDLNAALGGVGRRAFAILGSGLLQMLLIGLGLLLCGLPGIFAFILLFAVQMALMVEGTGVMDALGRSTDLAEGNLLRVFGTSVLSYLVFLAAVFGLTVLIALLAGVDTPLARVLGSVVTIFTLPFPVVASTVLYFDLRIRKEGFGLDSLADLGGPEAPRPGPAGY